MKAEIICLSLLSLSFAGSLPREHEAGTKGRGGSKSKPASSGRTTASSKPTATRPPIPRLMELPLASRDPLSAWEADFEADVRRGDWDRYAARQRAKAAAEKRKQGIDSAEGEAAESFPAKGSSTGYQVETKWKGDSSRSKPAAGLPLASSGYGAGLGYVPRGSAAAEMKWSDGPPAFSSD